MECNSKILIKLNWLLITGMDFSPIVLANIEIFASRVVALADYRLHLSEYLRSKMAGVAPNLATLIGDQVGA